MLKDVIAVFPGNEGTHGFSKFFNNNDDQLLGYITQKVRTVRMLMQTVE
jgi:hypothetical protein